MSRKLYRYLFVTNSGYPGEGWPFLLAATLFIKQYWMPTLSDERSG